MKNFIKILLMAILFNLLFFYGIDRELARQDYVKGVVSEGCIFKVNCDFYNKKLM